MKIEVFYTGGGIWLAEAEIDGSHYAVIDNENPNFLSVYRTTENEDERYMPEDMDFCEAYENLAPEYQKLHAQMEMRMKEKGIL